MTGIAAIFGYYFSFILPKESPQT